MRGLGRDFRSIEKGRENLTGERVQCIYCERCLIFFERYIKGYILCQQCYVKWCKGLDLGRGSPPPNLCRVPTLLLRVEEALNDFANFHSGYKKAQHTEETLAKD